MSLQPPLELAPFFTAVEQTLSQNRGLLNQADLVNGNHGDHMIAVFHLAARAAEDKQDVPLPDAMEYAAGLLGDQSGNGSARVYSSGLAQLASQFRKYELSLEDFVGYVRQALRDNKEEAVQNVDNRSKDVLKALLAALANWKLVEAGKPPADTPLDMGFLFDLGVAYMQAKQRGGTDRVLVLADAAASVSPLSSVPHRLQSGKLAIESLLEAMRQTSIGI